MFNKKKNGLSDGDKIVFKIVASLFRDACSVAYPTDTKLSFEDFWNGVAAQYSMNSKIVIEKLNAEMENNK